MKNFNRWLYMPIFTMSLSLLLWFIFLRKATPVGALWVSIALNVIAAVIFILPDPTDHQEDKDASNWRVWVTIIMCIVSVFYPVIMHKVS